MKMMPDVGRFQCGVAALIYHPPTQTYLLLQRARKLEYGYGQWECVTGRVNQGESFETALHREVLEEIGVRVQVDFIIGTTRFYRGDPTPDNELLGVKYACTIDDRDAITISEEHSAIRWLTASQVSELLPADHWLTRTIERAELMRNALPPALIEHFRATGFETD
nr:MAG: hypothetical protein DIU68_16630 [Chloroflexota bacterium]